MTNLVSQQALGTHIHSRFLLCHAQHGGLPSRPGHGPKKATAFSTVTCKYQEETAWLVFSMYCLFVCLSLCFQIEEPYPEGPSHLSQNQVIWHVKQDYHDWLGYFPTLEDESWIKWGSVSKEERRNACWVGNEEYLTAWLALIH